MSAMLRKLLLWFLVGVIVVIVAQSILGFLARIFTLVLLGGLVVLVLSLGRSSDDDE